MKKILFSAALLLTMNAAFSQHFMHGAGLAFMGGVSNHGDDISYAEGFTYSPRFNFVENEKLSVSVGVPLTAALSASYSYSSYYGSTTSIGFTANVPLIINLNMGRGSTKENRQKFGYFVGAGFGYHHGDFLETAYDEYGYGYDDSRSVNTVGPAANAGVRFGVGRQHRNIEVRLSYMKGITDTKPHIFGIAGLFNF